MTNNAATIEQQAVALAPAAFAQAMTEERQRMRRKSVPKENTLPLREPELRTSTAETLAGQYAVCLQHGNGKLWAIGAAHDLPDPPIADLQAGTFDHIQLFGQQRLVIGICCRYLRRWVEPRLLPFPRGMAGPLEREDVER